MDRGCESKRCRTSEENEMKDEDRLSNLPDSIAHHIFSFLTNIEDVARLRFTSKRCEHLCFTIPSLIINATQISCMSSDRKFRFMDFLVGLILNRQSAKLTSLAIQWSNMTLFPRETCRVMSMLSSAIQCHVSELDLNLRLASNALFVIPLDLFCSKSLTSLKVKLNSGMVELPCPYGFSRLKTLHLKRVEIVQEDIGEWISSFCKFLKELHVEELWGITEFEISCSSLVNIRIWNCSLHHLDISGQSLRSVSISEPFRHASVKGTLKICAPNVHKLALHVRNVLSSFSLGKMDLLQGASLILGPGVGKTNSNSLLQSIAQTHRLWISSECIRTMYDDGCLPFIFNQLQWLTVDHSGLTDDVVPSIAMFIQELQLGLKALRIKGKKRSNLFSTTTSEYRLKFWNILFLGGLEEIEMDLVGGKNEEVLVEYILNNAKNVKSVIISYGSTLPARIANKLTTLGSDVNFQSMGGKILLKPKL